MDDLTPIGSRDDWLWIAHHWGWLQALLQGSSGSALTGMPGAASSDPALVIDMQVSDLMHEISTAARFYGQILSEDAPPLHGCDSACDHTEPPTLAKDCPQRRGPITTSTMPGLLFQVARRYGHFTEGDDRTALEFMDAAHEFRRRVDKVLHGTDPATHMGPCPADNCDGELYLPADRTVGSCPECGTEYTAHSQRTYLAEAMESRLMTLGEIASAFVVLDIDVPYRTVQSWARRGKIAQDEDGLYRLADAVGYAQRRKDVAA